MNDSDEDAEAEQRLQQRMEQAGSSSPPSPALLAPAALYLTAILEYVKPVCPPRISSPRELTSRPCRPQGHLRVRYSRLFLRGPCMPWDFDSRLSSAADMYCPT